MLMFDWSDYIYKIPILGGAYLRNYFFLKRNYVNVLRKLKIRPGPLLVHWLSTYRCNSHCKYCEASANDVKSDELTTAQIKNVLDDLCSLKTQYFFVTGGEPLIRTDLFDVLDHAKQKGMKIGMITNSLLFYKHGKKIKDIGLDSIYTSVDGLEKTHNKNRGYPNAYDTTLEAIRYYADINIPLRVVNTLVHPGNFEEIPGLFEELKAAGINRWRLALAIPVGRAVEDDWTLPSDKIKAIFSYVAEERKNFDIELSEELGYLGCWDIRTKNSPFICPAGLTFCVIMPDGHILPCQIVYDTKYSEGNIKSTSIKKIWKYGFKNFRYVRLEGECSTCIHRKACSGGCWGKNLAEGKCLKEIWDSQTNEN
jgi:radical SAM protein with 4Fe4S-binding SPASM domain